MKVFQVQYRSVGEKNFGDGPWCTVHRCETLDEARAYIKANPKEWQEAQVFCNPADVDGWMP